MAFVGSVHIPIAGVALAAVAADWPLILLPIHVLFLEMVIDPACTIVFEADPEAEGIMVRPPRAANEPILDREVLWRSVLRGLAATPAALAVAGWGAAAGWSEDILRAAATLAAGLLSPALRGAFHFEPLVPEGRAAVAAAVAAGFGAILAIVKIK